MKFICILCYKFNWQVMLLKISEVTFQRFMLNISWINEQKAWHHHTVNHTQRIDFKKQMITFWWKPVDLPDPPAVFQLWDPLQMILPQLSCPLPMTVQITRVQKTVGMLHSVVDDDDLTHLPLSAAPGKVWPGEVSCLAASPRAHRLHRPVFFCLDQLCRRKP